jgi:hypothetical protein
MLTPTTVPGRLARQQRAGAARFATAQHHSSAARCRRALASAPGRPGWRQQPSPAPRGPIQLHAAPPDGPLLSPEQVNMSDPANAMLAAEDEAEQKPLVEQVEEERADEDRETFITESGLVEEVEEEDAQVREGPAEGGGGCRGRRRDRGASRQRHTNSRRQEQRQKGAPTSVERLRLPAPPSSTAARVPGSRRHAWIGGVMGCMCSSSRLPCACRPAYHCASALLCCPAALPPPAQFDYLGETTEGNLHLVQRLQRDGMVNVFGLDSLQDIVTVPVADLAAATQVSGGYFVCGGGGRRTQAGGCSPPGTRLQLARAHPER